MGSYPDSFHRKSLRTFSVATEKLYDGFGRKSNFRRDKKVAGKKMEFFRKAN